jgi:riboflavin kinase/FMN adenylyltransferase
MSVHLLHWFDLFPQCCRGAVLSVGNFDGVHLGHAALLTEAQRQAKELGGPVVAVSFDPHPLQILRPENFEPLLATPTDRAGLLHQRGADHVILLRTSQEMLSLTAPGFFKEVIRDRLDAKGIVEGPNFAFGRNRQGTIETLAQYCREAGLAMIVVPSVLFEGQPISSSRVRKALLRGDVRNAAAMLDRPYRLEGQVVAGQHRGSTLGFPTANLDDLSTLIPGDGVYAVQVSRSRDPGRPPWPGAVHIGPNPTFGEHRRKVEAHLIGFSGDLMGERLALDFLERLRDTHAFASKGDLVRQLENDVANARRLADQWAVHDSASGVRTNECGTEATGLIATLPTRLSQVLEHEVQPGLSMDGIRVQLVSIEKGVARLRLVGNHTEGPTSIMAIMMEIERILRRRVPEIEYVEIVP